MYYVFALIKTCCYDADNIIAEDVLGRTICYRMTDSGTTYYFDRVQRAMRTPHTGYGSRSPIVRPRGSVEKKETGRRPTQRK